jgi:hypothetical protein
MTTKSRNTSTDIKTLMLGTKNYNKTETIYQTPALKVIKIDSNRFYVIDFLDKKRTGYYGLLQAEQRILEEERVDDEYYGDMDCCDCKQCRS